MAIPALAGYTLNGQVKDIDSGIFRLEYFYNELNDVDGINEYHGGSPTPLPVSGAGVYSYDYGYDAARRVTSVDYPAPDPLNPGIPIIALDGYDYDARGNRADVVSNEFEYNEDNRLTEVPNTSTRCYFYDADGNLDEIDSIGTDCSDSTDWGTLVWGKLNRLESVSQGASQLGSYQYDRFGRRIAKTSGANMTLYLWDGDVLLAEYDASSGDRTLRYTYSGGFSPIQFVVNDSSEEVFDVHLPRTKWWAACSSDWWLPRVLRRSKFVRALRLLPPGSMENPRWPSA